MLIVSTHSREVYRNLEIEEELLSHALNLPTLFLYVNAPCVVIGKNQNPWRECRLQLMEKEGVSLARRISGGGAVYHDEGNLNFGVVVPRAEFREESQYDLIIQALEKFGIQTSRLRKNSLAVDGKKFSGQAFCFRGARVLHHGTLLVNSDLARLRRYLGADLDGIETRAVASIPAEVANLASFAPDLHIETLSAALVETFKERYKTGCVESDPDRPGARPERISTLEKKSSWDWLFGRTPRFEVVINGQRLFVERGRITNLAGHPQFQDFLRNRHPHLLTP